MVTWDDMDDDPRAYGRWLWLEAQTPRVPWSTGVRVPNAAWHTGRAFPLAVEATRAALAFLEADGMQPLAADDGVEREGEAAVMGWTSSTRAVLAVVNDASPLSFLVVEVTEAPPSIRILINRARRRSSALVGFGSFPLVGGDRATLDAEIGSYIGLLRDALGPDPGRGAMDALGLRLASEGRRLTEEREIPSLHRRLEEAWTSHRDAEFLVLSERLQSFGETVDPVRLAAASAAWESRLPPAARPLTIEGIRTAAAGVADAFGAKPLGQHPWSLNLVYRRMVTRELWDAFGRLQSADPTAVEPALVFLEADPWAFRTGYLKGRVMRHLRRCPMDDEQQARLRAVLLHLVDVGGRMEFGDACRLAWRVADPDFMAQLRSRADDPLAASGQRARWMLDAIRPPAGT